MQAIWNDIIIAESDETVIVEGNHYFPPDTVKWEYFTPHETQTTCPWKGQASYYTVEAGGQQNPGGAWTYRDPKPAASQIKDHVAFWRGVQVVES